MMTSDLNVALVGAAKRGQLDAMRLLRVEWGAKNANKALAGAAKYGQLPAMRLLHSWGAVLPSDVDTRYLHDEVTRLPQQWAASPPPPPSPAVDRSSLDKGFFLAVLSRLTRSDYVELVLLEKMPGHWRMCVKMAPVAPSAVKREWYLEANDETVTYWRSVTPLETFHWTGALVGSTQWEVPRKEARVALIVPIFETYVCKTL